MGQVEVDFRVRIGADGGVVARIFVVLRDGTNSVQRKTSVWRCGRDAMVTHKNETQPITCNAKN
jgi:hypothetical protein